jgi:hypothetical protein
MKEAVAIHGTDFWVKVIEMLQQNWAVIEPDPSTGVRVYFITDTNGVFDEIDFPSTVEASDALRRNGFRCFSDAPDLQSFLRQPSKPFWRSSHPNGPMYSSGRFWRS